MKLRAWVTLLPIGSYGLTQTRKTLTPLRSLRLSSAPTRPGPQTFGRQYHEIWGLCPLGIGDQRKSYCYSLFKSNG